MFVFTYIWATSNNQHICIWKRAYTCAHIHRLYIYLTGRARVSYSILTCPRCLRFGVSGLVPWPLLTCYMTNFAPWAHRCCRRTSWLTSATVTCQMCAISWKKRTLRRSSVTNSEPSAWRQTWRRCRAGAN